MTAQTTPPTGTDLLGEIDRLRKERNAVILAHYYQSPQIQDLADFVGDSLQLSQMAAETDADVIAFCGVKFMADTAKILSAGERSSCPARHGCRLFSLEDSCPPEKFKAFREAHPDHIALTYINCSTEVKALCDVIVTSVRARRRSCSRSPKDQKIIFGPDRHLGGYLSRKFDREMLLWPGCLHRARGLQRDRAAQAEGAASRRASSRRTPNARRTIVDHADYVGSTSGILQYAPRASRATR